MSRIEKEYSHLDDLGAIGQSVEVTPDWEPDKERNSRCCRGSVATPSPSPLNGTGAIVGLANDSMSESLPGHRV